MKKTLRQVSFKGMGVFAGIAYEPCGRYGFSGEYYSLDNGKYTLLRDIEVIDQTGAYYRKVVRRINCSDIREWTQFNSQYVPKRKTLNK